MGGTERAALACIYDHEIASKWKAALKHRELSPVPCDDLEGWGGVGWGGVGVREAPEGGDVCIHPADSHCCTEGTNTTL